MNPCMYVHVHICCYSDQSANSISSHGDYSRAASISFRACSGAATIRERRLFESSVYSVIYGMRRLKIRKDDCIRFVLGLLPTTHHQY